jgi:hypothetical protein
VILGPIGWFRDPYEEHEDRYFSQGFPTKLVRDHGVEAYDPPPDGFLPQTLIPAPGAPEPARRRLAWLWRPARYQDDQRRADDNRNQPAYLCKRSEAGILDYLGL